MINETNIEITKFSHELGEFHQVRVTWCFSLKNNNTRILDIITYSTKTKNVSNLREYF